MTHLMVHLVEDTRRKDCPKPTMPQQLKLSTTTHFQSFFSHCGQF
jgi:hypothetical protein